MGQICDVIGRVAPATAIAGATTDFFAAALSGNVSGKVMTVSVSLDAGVKLNLRVNGVNMPFNSDVALVANALYTFSFMANGTDTFNFRAGGACNVNYFTL